MTNERSGNLILTSTQQKRQTLHLRDLSLVPSGVSSLIAWRSPETMVRHLETFGDTSWHLPVASRPATSFGRTGRYVNAECARIIWLWARLRVWGCSVEKWENIINYVAHTKHNGWWQESRIDRNRSYTNTRAHSYWIVYRNINNANEIYSHLSCIRNPLTVRYISLCTEEPHMCSLGLSGFGTLSAYDSGFWMSK